MTSRADIPERPHDTPSRGGDCPDPSAPTSASTPPHSIPEPSPARLGDFRIIREVGRGGMGVVYEAEQISLGRPVALKVLPTFAAHDRKQVARFQVEALAAARLHHPHVVPVFAIGSEDGVHFYAMQFIEGLNLAELIRERRGRARVDVADTVPADPALTAGGFGPDDSGFDSDWEAPTPPSGQAEGTTAAVDFRVIARLGIEAAEALDYAHGQGVLHRDIKPSNLMIDARGAVWVTDFGLARLRGGSSLTGSNALVGTLRYMSPEQVASDRARVDHRADIYALGATLYELLTLRPAFDGRDRARLLLRIAEEDPIAPRRFDASIPRDLETIVLKAMAKRPAERYATAAELAEDLRRFLEGRPVHARRPTLRDRAAKWLWRHRSPVMTAAAMAALMVATVVAGLAWSNAQLRTERDRADYHADQALRLRGLAEDRARLADRRLFADRWRHAQEALRSGQIEHAQDLLATVPPDPTSFVDRFLRDRADAVLTQLRGHAHDVVVLEPSPAGDRLASSARSGAIILWDLEEGRPAARLEGHTIPPKRLAFSADGLRLASAATRPGTTETEVFVWDLAARRRIARVSALDASTVHDIALAGGGRQLEVDATLAGRDHEGRLLFDLEAAPTRRPVAGRLVACLPGSGLLGLVRGDDGGIALRDLRTGAERWSIPEPTAPWTVEAAPDGSVLAFTLAGREILLLDAGTGEALGRQPADARLGETIVGPGGRTVLALEGSGTVVIWDRAGGRVHRVDPDGRSLPAPDVRLALSADGRTLAASTYGSPGGQGPVTAWDVATGTLRATFPGRPDRADTLAFDGDGRSLLINGGPTIRRWWLDRPDPGLGPDRLAGHTDEAWSVAYSSDGSVLATGSDDTTDPLRIRLWDARTGAFLRGWPGHEATVTGLAFAPGGSALASVALSPDRNARLWDPETGTLLAELAGHDGPVRALAFSRDGTTLATAGDDRTIRLWDGKTGDALAVLRGHADKVRSLAFSPDGRTLASTSNDRTVRLWDVSSRSERARFTGPERFAGLAYAPHGRTLAAADEDGDLFILDARDGRRLLLIQADEIELRALAYSPDGRTLAAAGMSRAIRLWDPETGQELLVLDDHEAQVNGLAFAPDGLSLASTAHDGSVAIWRAESDVDPEGLDPSPEGD